MRVRFFLRLCLIFGPNTEALSQLGLGRNADSAEQIQYGGLDPRLFG